MVEVTASAGTRITNTAQIATSNPYDQGDPWEKYSEWSGEVQANDTHLNVGKKAWTNDPAPATTSSTASTSATTAPPAAARSR